MKQYINVKRIVGSIAIFLLFLTGSVHAQFQTTRFDSGGSRPLDITMISSMVLQPAWLSNQTNSLTQSEGIEIIRPITTQEQLDGSGQLNWNNRMGGTRGLAGSETRNRPCAFNLAPLESRTSSAANGYYVGLVYADCDDDNSTFQSSASMLNIGTESCTSIEKAFLYWSGYDVASGIEGNTEVNYKTPYKGFATMRSYDGPGNVGNDIDNDKCLFKTPGGNYVSLTGTLVHKGGAYTYVADVTDLINSLENANGLYWVANVKSGVNTTSVSTGWSLVVIYSSASTPPRSVLLLDGDILGGNITVDLGNNKPAYDNSISYLGYIGIDSEDFASDLGCGRAAAENANIMIQSNNGAPTFVQQFLEQDPISFIDANTSSSNCTVCTEGFDGALSSTLTTYSALTGKNGNQLGRLPDTRYTIGYDAHHVRLPQGAVRQDATSVTFTLPSEQGGTYNARMAYLAIETLEPVLTIDKAIVPGLSSDLNNIDTNALENTEITYRIGVNNATSADLGGGTFTGTATVTDPLPVGLDIITEGGDYKIKYYYYHVENDGTQTPVNKINPNICWRVAVDADGRHTLTVENNEPLGENEGFYVDVFTRLKPYDSAAWAENCNRVIKNVAYLNYGSTNNPQSDACNPNVDLDASAAIDSNWDTNLRTLINVQIETGNSIVTDINADPRLTALGGGFAVYRCTGIELNGDCFGSIAGLPQLSGETYDGTPNQLFIAYKESAALVLGEDSWTCYRAFIVRPVPPSPAFTVEATKATVSCATGQGTNDDGVVRALVDTKQQNISFNYELRDINGNAIAGTGGSKTELNSNEAVEISSFSGLSAGTYYIYISGLDYDNIAASVERNGFISADGTLQPNFNAAANPAPVALLIAEPAALTAPVITANALERCLNNGDIITLTAAATGAGDISYVWTPADGVSGTGNNTLTQTPTQKGDLNFSVMAQNENGCKSETSATTTVKVGDVPVFNISGLESTFCSNAGTALASITPADPNVTYSWTSTVHGQNQGTSWNLATSGSANITVTGVDNSYTFCTRTAPTVPFNVEQEVMFGSPAITATPDKSAYDIGEQVMLTVNATGNVDPASLIYSWTADGSPIAAGGAALVIPALQQTTAFEVSVRNPAGVCAAAIAPYTLYVCQAKFTMSPAAAVKRCANNPDPLVFTATPDPKSPIDHYILILYNESGEEYRESNSIGIFNLEPSVLNSAGRNGRVSITAVPVCNPDRQETQSVDVMIYDEVRIADMLVNGNSTNAAEIQIGEALGIEIIPAGTGNLSDFLYIINNDIWTLGNVYIDYPLNDKTYEVVLTNHDRICSDTRLVNVTVKPLPNAVLSFENANFDRYIANNMDKTLVIAVVGKWQLYNRYGQEEFSASSTADEPTVSWFGQDKNDKQLPAGTYFYVYTTPKGDVKRGTVEIVK